MYIVYKIINKINNKIYIGVHNGTDPNYMGSGKLIKQAIIKYKIENFEKRILYKTEHENLAYALEEKLVTEEFIKRKDTYNLKLGGTGGRHSSSFTEKERKQKSKFLKENNPAWNMSIETKKKISEFRKGKPSPSKGNFKVEGDGKWKGTSHKDADNPRAKLIYIFNENNDIIYKCNGTFYKKIKQFSLPSQLEKSFKNNGEPLKFNWKCLQKDKRELYKKYEGWYAKEMKKND